jgi:hypothetical protein
MVDVRRFVVIIDGKHGVTDATGMTTAAVCLVFHGTSIINEQNRGLLL